MAVTVLAGVVGIAGYIVVTHHGAAANTRSTASSPAQPAPHDISNRQADPAPLSVAEVFPGATLNPSGYHVMKTVAITNCKAVAVGQPIQVLSDAGCNQGVLATVTSADQTYVATAGLLNLTTEAGAEQASTALHGAVGPQKGRLTGYDAGGASVILLKAPTQLGWDVRGHFLGYCVVARADGKPLDGTDAGARKVIDDLVEKYLIGTVLQGRVSPSPSPKPPPASAPPARKSGK